MQLLDDIAEPAIADLVDGLPPAADMKNHHEVNASSLRGKIKSGFIVRSTPTEKAVISSLLRLPFKLARCSVLYNSERCIYAIINDRGDRPTAEPGLGEQLQSDVFKVLSVNPAGDESSIH